MRDARSAALANRMTTGGDDDEMHSLYDHS